MTKYHFIEGSVHTLNREVRALTEEGYELAWVTPLDGVHSVQPYIACMVLDDNETAAEVPTEREKRLESLLDRALSTFGFEMPGEDAWAHEVREELGL